MYSYFIQELFCVGTDLSQRVLTQLEEGSADTEEGKLMMAASKGTVSRPRGRKGGERQREGRRGMEGETVVQMEGRRCLDMTFTFCRRGQDSSWGCGAICTSGLLLRPV